ncbi:amidase [Parafrankia sp. EUN1f]|nr:amidase [Parafrankia sp. EUN1f]
MTPQRHQPAFSCSRGARAVNPSGMPLGMQVVGPSYDDAAPFALAAALEAALPRPAWPM